MRDYFVNMGIFTEEEAGEIEAEHAAFEQASSLLACTLESEYEALDQAAEQEAARERELVKKLQNLAASPSFCGMQNNVRFRQRLESGVHEITSGEYPILSCGDALEHAVSLMTELLKEYEKAREETWEAVRQSVGDSMWNEFSPEFKNPDFFNNLCYYESGAWEQENKKRRGAMGKLIDMCLKYAAKKS